MSSRTSNVFLVQVTEKGSVNILQDGRYRNEDWHESVKDADHGKVKSGDLLLVYFAGGAVDYQKQLRFVYRVSAVTPDNKEFKLEEYKEIAGLTLDKIREQVDTGQLSKSFLNCGRQGFNIKQIDYPEFTNVVEISRDLPTPQPIGAEDILEDFIVNNWNPGSYFGADFIELQILTNESGEMVGQQFDTGEIGRIDLLCRDKKTGAYVVIELKRGLEKSDSVVGQLARYVSWIKEKMANGLPVSGIILAAGYDNKLIYAIKSLKDCYLAEYQVRFTIALRR